MKKTELHLEHPHTLGREAARDAVRQVAERMQADLGGTHRWQGDTLLYQRDGARARIEAQERVVVVDVTLGKRFWLMRKTIKNTIETHLTGALDAPPV